MKLEAGRGRWRQLAPGWRWLLAAWMAYALAMAGVQALRLSRVPDTRDYAGARAAVTSDFRDYWFSARHLRETGSLTTQFGVTNYLPCFTIFMLPWSLMPLWVAGGLFVLLSAMLLGLVTWQVEALLGGTPRDGPSAAVIATLGLVLAYAHSRLQLGAVDPLVLFLVIATWTFCEQRREWLGGGCLGLAILVKVLPAALLAFFLLRRRWRAAGGALIVTLVGAVGVPLLTLGPKATVDEYRGFFRRAVVEQSAQATLLGQAPDNKANYSNFSLPIVLRRLGAPTDAGKGGRPLFVNIANLSGSVLLSVYIAVAAVVLGVTAWRTATARQPWPPDTPAQLAALRAQFGAWCGVLLLLAPLVWTRYLLLMYWPLALATDEAVATLRRWRQGPQTRRRILHSGAVWAVALWLAAVPLLAWPLGGAPSVRRC